MKNNLYSNSIQKIKAPTQLIDNTVKNLRGVESEVLTVNKQKGNKYKFVSAIAAVLALIIGFGVFTFVDGSGNEHSFMIKAGAAEITPDTYISLGMLESSNTNGHYMHMDSEFKEAMVLKVGREFNVDIQCIGENIESVTYTANNAYFQYFPDFAGLMNVVEMTDKDIKKYDAGGSANGSKIASSCTYEYNNQPRSLWNTQVAGFEIPEEYIDGTVPLRIAINLFPEEGKYIRPLENQCYVDDDDIFYSEFNAHAEEYSLDITANFADGTKVTKTITFMCDNSMSQLQLLAKEVTD